MVNLFKIKLLAAVCLSLMLASNVSAATDTHEVEIKQINLDVLLNADSAEEIDMCLYPSGMELPTKYLDLFMFSDVAGTLNISDSVYQLLYKFSAGPYTIAEVKAAQMYLALAENSGTVCNCNNIGDAVSQFNKEYEGHSVVVSDISRFQKALVIYEQLLRDGVDFYVEEESTLYDNIISSEFLTLGENFEWAETLFYPDYSEMHDTLYNFIESRAAYANTLGLQFVECSEVVVEKDTPKDTEDLTPENENEETIDYGSLEASEYVKEFATGLTSSDATERNYNAKDIIMLISKIVVSLCIISSLVITSIRHYKNREGRRYRHW